MNRINKQVIFKDVEKFTCCINEINNAQVGSAKADDIAVPMYNY